MNSGYSVYVNLCYTLGKKIHQKKKKQVLLVLDFFKGKLIKDIYNFHILNFLLNKSRRQSLSF